MQEFTSFIVNNSEVLILISLWEVVWKGFGLWRASKNEDKAWFIAILILNTIGIVPIIYLLIDKKRNKK